MKNKLHILVVDDEIKICNLIAEILLEKGYVVSCFCNGRDALKYLTKSEVDLLILDIAMPGMNGIELLNKLKSLNIHIPTIILSAYYLKPRRREELEKEVFSFIDKPVDLDKLVESVGQAVSKEVCFELKV